MGCLDFYFSFVYFIGWKHSVGRDHYVFVDDLNSMLGYVNCQEKPVGLLEGNHRVFILQNL
jgi:hypothetical protein